VGDDQLLELLIRSGRCDLNARDARYNGTPLGWLVYGAHHCTYSRGDRLRSIELLIRAGANPAQATDSSGKSLLKQASGQPQVESLLRRLGV
jgi:hypothetical protein